MHMVVISVWLQYLLHYVLGLLKSSFGKIYTYQSHGVKSRAAARGAIAPHFSLTLKILLANNIVDDLTHTKLTDRDKKTLSHYNSYL